MLVIHVSARVGLLALIVLRANVHLCMVSDALVPYLHCLIYEVLQLMFFWIIKILIPLLIYLLVTRIMDDKIGSILAAVEYIHTYVYIRTSLAWAVLQIYIIYPARYRMAPSRWELLTV